MDEIAYINSKIDDEINELKSYKKNLRKFFYIESAKGKMIALDFNRIVDEIERLSIEISYLENQKTEYNKIKRLL